MAIFSNENLWVFAFGLLGNIASFVVFLAPVPTFVRVCKKKSTEGFQSLPYVVALLSAMLWLYYALIKSNAFLLITINSLGCLVETIYVALYITYAPKQARRFTLRMIIMLNIGGFCLILLMSYFFAKGPQRVKILGLICMAFSVTVFVAPLTIMRVVIRTKSVEYMPLSLSFFLTLSAIMWLFYGVLSKDLYVAIPNIVGFVLGLLQMVLYVIYKNFKAIAVDPNNNKNVCEHNIDMEKRSTHNPENDSTTDNKDILVQQHLECSKPNKGENDEEANNNNDKSMKDANSVRHQPNKCEI